MYDRLLFSLMALAAVAMIGLALVWPQGLGARAPGPFGREPMQQAKARESRAKGAEPPPVLSMAPVAPSSGPAP